MKQNNDSFIIHDGEIISPDDFPSDRHQRPKKETVPLQRLMIQIGSRVCDVTPVSGLSLISTKAFLTTSCSKDFEQYKIWLLESGYAPTSREAYGYDLKSWSKKLADRPFCKSVIEDILDSYKTDSSVRQRMLYSLHRYGHYRREKADDPSILMMLEIAGIKIKTHKLKKRRFKRWTEQERQMLTATVKLLCAAGDRTGIYLGLLILGVPINQLNVLKIQDNSVLWSFHKQAQSAVIPDFLLDAISKIQWQPAHSQGVWRHCRPYGYKIFDLKNCGLKVDGLTVEGGIK